MSRPRPRSRLRLLVLGLLVACSDVLTGPGHSSRPSAPAIPADPLANIADGAHAPGNPHFHFLPPMTPQPGVAGNGIDATLLPNLAVEICAWTNSACGPTVARLTADPTSPDVLRLDGQQYAVDWHTGQAALDVTKTYRLRVLAAHTELGHADIKLGRNASDLKGLDPTQYVGVVLGQTLPVKFRVEPGAVWVFGANGGTLTAQNGQASLNVPSGALGAPTGITVLVPLAGDIPSDSASLAHTVPGSAWDFEPTGTTFTTPATLTLKYDTSAVPKGVKPRALRLMFAQNGKWVAVPSSSVNPLTGTITGKVSHFTAYAASQSAVADSILSLQAELDSLTLTGGDVARTVQIELALAALYQMSPAPEYQTEAIPFLQQAMATACTQYTNVAQNAQVVVVANYGDLTTFLTPVMDWYALTQKLGATCSGAPDFVTLVDAKLAQFTTLYTKALQQSASTPDPCFGCLVQEYGRVVQLVGVAQQLGLTATATDLANNAQTPLAMQMRASAFTNCQLRQRQTAPGLLLAMAGKGTPYSSTDIQQDIEWCASSVSWELDRANGTVKAKGTLGGSTPTAVVTTATTSGLAAGTLVIKGNVTPLTCQDGSVSPGEQLTIVEPTHNRTLYSQTLQPPAIASLLPAPVSIDVGQLLTALSLDPAQQGQVDLQLVRTSTGCSGFYGPPAPYTLGTITLQYPTITVAVSPASPQVAPRGTQQFTAAIKGTTNQTVAWSATGGTIDATGLYTAGQTPGKYQVTAVSAADTTVADSTVVTVASPLKLQRVETASCIRTDFTDPGIIQLYAPLGPTPPPSLPFNTTQSQCGGQITLGIIPVTGGAEFDVDVSGGAPTTGGFGFGIVQLVLTMDFPTSGQLTADFNFNWPTSYPATPTDFACGVNLLAEKDDLSALYGFGSYMFNDPTSRHVIVGQGNSFTPFPANGQVVMPVQAGRARIYLGTGGACSGTGRFVTLTFTP